MLPPPACGTGHCACAEPPGGGTLVRPLFCPALLLLPPTQPDTPRPSPNHPERIDRRRLIIFVVASSSCYCQCQVPCKTSDSSCFWTTVLGILTHHTGAGANNGHSPSWLEVPWRGICGSRILTFSRCSGPTALAIYGTALAAQGTRCSLGLQPTAPAFSLLAGWLLAWIQPSTDGITAKSEKDDTWFPDPPSRSRCSWTWNTGVWSPAKYCCSQAACI
ncbi:uncharacterized protein LOC132352370 isoform X2 [Balaenoptera ricei]|uniref:uncharacterized protein LOC132352370 isoform X2 n=1 Tax=Balaenoptera ricei TaxID=2746895 RepID=UPI0028BED2C3|nr:uncharacterized protein LOC132352370 isoform X2 [Balaenoptera ricei]